MIGSHNSDIDLTFYNDKVKEVIDAGIMAEPFTYVPIKAGHMELVGGNAVVFGKITEGYDVIAPSVETEMEFQPITYYGGAIGDEFLAPKDNLSVKKLLFQYITIVHYPDTYLHTLEYHVGDFVRYSGYVYKCKATTVANLPNVPLYDNPYWVLVFWNAVASYRRTSGVVVIHLPSIVYVDSYYYITVANAEEGITSLTAYYEAQETDTIADVKAGIEAALLTAGVSPGDVETGSGEGTIYLYKRVRYYEQSPNYKEGDVNTVYKDFTFDAYISTLGYTNKYPQLKCGATHGFGIVYKDGAGRTCSVTKTDAMSVYIPFYTEDEDNIFESIIKLVFKIFHTPPIWAETYEIVYFGNLTMDYFLQLRADNITVIPLSNGNRFALNIQDTLEWTWNKNNRWKVDAYTWLPGDRMRLMGTIDDVSGIVTRFDTLYDYEIEETANQSDDVINGEWLIFQAKNNPSDFDNINTTIINLTGTLGGTVIHTANNGSTTKRVDTITLSGTDGSAIIKCGMLEKTVIWHTSLTQTAINFVTENDASYLDIGIVLTSNYYNLIFTASTAGVDFPGLSNILIEIYRPRKGLAITAAYGTGIVFDIDIDVFGHKYHKGDVDQSLDEDGSNVSPAEIANTANDCWKYMRLNYKHATGNILPFWAESMFPSDWWDDQDINRKLTSSGFPFLDDLSQRQVVLDERIRHGGFLITGTRTNNIAHFTFDDFMDLSTENGDITGLREVGFTLKIIQLHKETSVYINRIQTFNPDGTEQFTLTDKFLAQQRPMETDYGCQHPDSIMVNGRDLYYWDNNEGEFIRSSPNGQIAISGPDYKMSRWFKDIVKWINSSGGRELLETRTGANNDHGEIWLTFRMGTEVRGVIFSEKQGRYVSRLNQITESYVHLGNFFAHLYHQRLWIMNIDEGQDYLSWSGMRTYAEVEVVSNIEPLRNKIFNAVALFADHLLQSLAKFVRIPAEASGSNELMESNIPIWDRREGIYFGEILRDENSPGNFVSVIDAKMNGRLLRGRYCFVRFKTEEHDEKVRIDSVVIHSTPSERNV